MVTPKKEVEFLGLKRYNYQTRSSSPAKKENMKLQFDVEKPMICKLVKEVEQMKSETRKREQKAKAKKEAKITPIKESRPKTRSQSKGPQKTQKKIKIS